MHATVRIGEYIVPLLGIPEEATQEICDVCKIPQHLTDITFKEGRFLCMHHSNPPPSPQQPTFKPMEVEYDRIEQFAIRTSVSTRCICNWIRQRKIPYLKVDRVVLIPWREALENLNRKYRVNAYERGER